MNEVDKNDSLVLVLYVGLLVVVGHVYCEVLVKAQTNFLPKKKRYVSFGRLNKV